MKRIAILTLLCFVAAFSFSQTNATFKNLDIRDKTHLRGQLKADTAVLFPHLKPELRINFLLGWEHTTGNVFATSAQTLADSLSLLMHQLWRLDTPDTIKTDYNVVVDSSLTVNKTINIPATTATVGQIKQGGVTVFHTYHEKGDNNLYIGQNTGNFTADSSFNVGIGYNVLNSLTTGYSNIGIGNSATSNISSGNLNIGIGYEALRGSGTPSSNTGYRNVAIGNTAGTGLTSGSWNVLIGSGTGNNISTGNSNVYLGVNTGMQNNTGSDNTGIGSSALFNNYGNSRSVAIGMYSMLYADDRTSGRITYNTAIGYEAMKGSLTPANNTGQYNTAVGYQALDAMTSGAYNTVFGVDAGGGITTGASNVLLGYSAGSALTTESNKLYIENSNSATPLIGGDFSTDAVTINGSLNVTGQITYDYKHLIVYTSGGSYNPNVTQNVEFRLLPGFSTTENDGFTFAGDSIVIITPGDYYINFATVFQAANGDDWLFKCRKNGVAITTGNLALSTTGAGNYCTGMWFWYVLGLVAGDRICFTVTGENVGADDPTFRSIKVYMKKEME